MLYYYENKQKVLEKQKERRNLDKTEINKKRRELYHKKKVEILLNKFEAKEIGVIV